MTDDFETRIRTMLRDRADDVDAVRSLAHDADDIERGSFVLQLSTETTRPRRRPPALVIIAAAVVLVVGVAFFVAHRRHTQPTPPATPSPIAVRTCSAELPASWLTQPLLGDLSTTGLAMTPEGQAVVLHTTGTAMTVELRTLHTAQVVYTVADAPDHWVQTASTDGRWLVIPVSYLHDRTTANGVSTVTSVVVVDLRSLTSRVLATVPSTGVTIDNAVLFDGSVYWDVRPSYGASTGTVQRFDLRTSRQTEAYHGNIVWLDLTAAGVSVGGLPSLTPTIPAELPAVVRASVGSPPDGSAIATDGASWTWLSADRQRLYWWRPGTAPRVIATPSDLDGTTLSYDELATADQIVVIKRHVIDMLTGAEATLPEGELVRAVGLGRLLMARTQELPTGLYHLDPNALPKLVC